MSGNILVAISATAFQMTDIPISGYSSWPIIVIFVLYTQNIATVPRNQMDSNGIDDVSREAMG